MLVTVVWDVFGRSLGAVFCVATANFWWQVVPLFGPRGISPTALLLARLRADLPLASAFALNPTVLWLSSSPAFLRCVVALGALGGRGLNVRAQV